MRGAKLEGFGVKFGFDIDRIGAEAGVTLAQALAQALTEAVDRVGTDLVLIVDEVQHAIASEAGNQLLLSLKAARDAINTRPDTPGHFILIGTGSHRALVNELTARRNQAFSGATSVPYPVLDRDYVDHLLQCCGSLGASLDAAFAFASLLRFHHLHRLGGPHHDDALVASAQRVQALVSSHDPICLPGQCTGEYLVIGQIDLDRRRDWCRWHYGRKRHVA